MFHTHTRTHAHTRRMGVRVGIVATSERLSLLLPLLRSLGIPVTAIWSRDHDNCRRLAAQFDVFLPAHHFQELLVHPEVDLVYVATDPALRAEVAVKAITSGKHCVSLSPISVGISDGEKMLSVSRYYPQLLSLVECHLRHLPASQAMRELLDAGYCGRVLVAEARVVMGSLVGAEEAYSWRCDPTVGGGALSNVGSHVIDLVSFTTRVRLSRVQGTLRTFRPQTRSVHGFRRITSDDFCSFQGELEGGEAVATVNINTHSQEHRYDFEYSVTGTTGRLVMRGMDLYGVKTDSDAAEGLIHKQDGLEIPSDDSATETLKQVRPAYHQSYLVGVREMFSALREDLEQSNQMLAPRRESLHNILVSASFEDGLYVRNVMDAVTNSSRCGRWVDVATVKLPETNNPFWTSSDARFSDSLSPTKKQRPSLV